MPLKCPVCNAVLAQNNTCQNGHYFQEKEGVLKLMTPDFENMLSLWLNDFEKVRIPTLQTLDFEHLPASGLKVSPQIWQARFNDIQWINNLLKPHYQNVLDIGSWNGWLANTLTKKGLQVTAIDYFTHELDGLNARKFYSNPAWRSIQMDLENLHPLDDTYDLIVVNRCYPYFTDQNRLLDYCIKHLNPGGVLFISGLNINLKKQAIAKETQALEKTFHKNSTKAFYFKPFKGYTDLQDLQQLKEMGFKVSLYPGFKNKIKTILRKGVVTYAATFEH